jgi:hypothetical protein
MLFLELIETEKIIVPVFDQLFSTVRISKILVIIIGDQHHIASRV